MIAANHRVALRMKSAIPHLAVFRSQAPPGEAELTQWRTRFVEAARNSVALQSTVSRRSRSMPMSRNLRLFASVE